MELVYSSTFERVRTLVVTYEVQNAFVISKNSASVGSYMRPNLCKCLKHAAHTSCHA